MGKIWDHITHMSQIDAKGRAYNTGHEKNENESLHCAVEELTLIVLLVDRERGELVKCVFVS